MERLIDFDVVNFRGRDSAAAAFLMRFLNFGI